jgi:GTP cyclohydrolase I
MMIKHVSYFELAEAARNTAKRIREYLPNHRDYNKEPLRIFAVPRGGIPAALAVLRHINIKSELITSARDADIFVDDLVDSGATRDRYFRLEPTTPFFTLFQKHNKEEWLTFPWEDGYWLAPVKPGEQAVVNTDGIGGGEDIPTRLLQFIGEDPQREGLRETPRRFLEAWRHWTSGYNKEPDLKAFAEGVADYDELVLVSNIPVYSHCEHHCTPMFGLAHVGYIPAGKIVGLSKLGRLVEVFARRLQVQEKMTSQIASALQEALQPQGVGVVLQLRHLCLESRGIAAHGAVTTTSAMLGALRDKPAARSEFLKLVSEGAKGVVV